LNQRSHRLDVWASLEVEELDGRRGYESRLACVA
jgi:hypothetical protein